MSDATTQNVENEVTEQATEGTTAQTAAAEAPVEREREPRRERDRDRDRRYRQEDLGPPVKGFGDSIPAFMLIPLPRPRAEKPAEPVELQSVEITASGNPRVNLPAPPGNAVNGRKAKISTAVQPITAITICCVPASAATS